MPCCGGHGGAPKLPAILSSRAPDSDDVAGDALLNLSVLKTLSEHVDAATAVACYSVCRAWREAFGLSCFNSTLCTSEPVDSTRSRFTANLHGAVALEITQSAQQSQRGFDRHVAALARNRHFMQLKVHLPVREASEPQLSLGALRALAPLTQMTCLVVSRNQAFTSAPHILTEDDLAALDPLRSLTFLELCTAVPPSLGLSRMASMASTSLTQLRTLAFGHTSALWRIPQVATLCQMLDVCPLLTDLRLRCCAPPRDAKQLPDLMALPLPQRLTNFALTFARRLGRGEHGVGGGAAAAAAAALAAARAARDDDDDSQYGEYETVDEPWESIDHLAPKPGLNVLIVDKGTRVTRMDVNVTISIAATELPSVSIQDRAAAINAVAARRRSRAALPSTTSDGSGTHASSSAGGAAHAAASAAEGASGMCVAAAGSEPDGESGGAKDGTAAGSKRAAIDGAAAGPSGSAAAAAALTTSAGGANDLDEDEENVPPYDVTPLVIAEYNRLLQQELGLTGPLAEPQDLHLGIRLDIVEDEDEGLAAAAAAAFNLQQHLPGGQQPPHQIFQVAAQIHAALQAAQQAAQQLPGGAGAAAPQAGPGAGAGGGGGAGGNAQGLLQGLLAALDGALVPAGGNGAGANLGMLLEQFAGMHLGGGGGGGAGGAGGGGNVNNAPGAQQQHQHQLGGGGGGARGNGAASALEARAVQLNLGSLSPHMCYLNVALVPMVTQLAMVGPGLGPNDEEVVQHPPADTRVAPVLLDVRGGGYTQLKSLAITGFVDQDCRPATWMSRGWLGRVPAGMPCLEYMALYDTLPAAANDPTAIEGLRNLPHMEHLELRPLYLRYTGEVPCPLTIPPPALPTKLVQLTLKKVTIPAPPLLPAGVSPGSSAALAGLPDLPVLTQLWLFDCTAPDLTVFRRATRLEDLRLGSTTTTTSLPDLLAPWLCLRGLILDMSHTAAPGWWSAHQMSALSSLRCLRSLQLDAASLEPPPPAPVAQSSAAAAGSAKPGVTVPRSQRAAGGAGPGAGTSTAPLFDSDTDSDAYLSTEEDGQPAQSLEGGASGGAAAVAPPAPAASTAGGGSGAATGAAAAGTSGNNSTDLASVLAVLAGLTQLTDLTLSFDTPTLFYEPEEEEAEGTEDGEPGGAGGAGAHGGEQGGATGSGDNGITEDSSGEDSNDSGDDNGDGEKDGSGAGGAAAAERSHSERVYDALLAGQSFVSLAALQGLWRLRIGLPHGSVWDDVTDRLLPAMRLAMPRTSVEMDVL